MSQNKMVGRNTIRRTITESIIKVAKIETVEGLPQTVELPDVKVVGNVNASRAQKIVNKEYKGENAVVFNIEKQEKVYEMSVKDFLEQATLVNDEEEETEKEEN